MPPRGAATVTKSHAAAVQELVQQAADLERQIQQSRPADNRMHLRVPLCECMSHLILLHPAVAVQQDIPNRLWKVCFYARIASWRKKLAQERKRGIPPTESKTQESYTIFLSEGVTLYQYLIGMLHQKLITATGGSTVAAGAASQDASSTVSSSSLGLPTVASPPPGTDLTIGVVQVLTACQVCLGDLLRYAENTTQATKAYRMAAALAPGHGHAYNQLAVLCQQQPPSSTKGGPSSGPPYAAVALYWYTRALLTNAPFSVAIDNLTRLYHSNHDWVVAQQSSSSNNRPGGNTTTPPDTRRFLAMWVDLQYRFYQFNHENDDDDDTVHQVLRQIDTVMDDFTATASALGDALLCRLVVIHVFSECFLDRPRGVPTPLIMTLARIATYRFGIRLVDQVRQGWAKANSSGTTSTTTSTKMPSSVRLLPLWLLAAYTSRVRMPATDHEGATLALELTRTQFWRGWLALVQTVEPWVRSSMNSDPQHGRSRDEDNEEETSSILVAMGKLKSLVELRGFGPFASFLPTATDSEGYLSSAQACETLRAETSAGKSSGRASETGSTTTSHSTTENNKDTGRLKMMGLVYLADQLVQDTDGLVGRSIVRDRGTGALIWKNTEDMEDSNDDDDDAVAMPMDEDRPVDSMQVEATTMEKKDENVLEYKMGADGGPALLVPTMLLQSTVTHEAVESKSPLKVQKSPANSETSEKLLPVFDATPVNLHPTDPPLAVPHATEPAIGSVRAFQNVTAGFQLPPPGMEPMVPNLPPPPGFGQSVPLVPPAASATATMPNVMLGQSQLPSTTQQPETLGEAMRMYGQELQQQTANPFANPPPPAAPGFTEAFPYSAAAPAPNNFFGSSDPSAEVSLLDSRLLSSLWMKDPSSKSRNPFAT